MNIDWKLAKIYSELSVNFSSKLTKLGISSIFSFLFTLFSFVWILCRNYHPTAVLWSMMLALREWRIDIYQKTSNKADL